MKNLPLLLLSLSCVWLSATCVYSAEDASDTIAFRYVAADEAFGAVKEQVGQSAVSAVSSIDVKKNAIVLDSTHPQVAKVREFLHSFDYKRPMVIVRATIKKVAPATAATPATEQVLSQPTIMGKPGSKMNLWSGDDGLQIELVVDATPGERPTIDDPVWTLGQQIQADIDALIAVRSRTPADNALLEDLKDFLAIMSGLERATTRKEAEQIATTLRQFLARRDVAGFRAWASRNKD